MKIDKYFHMYGTKDDIRFEEVTAVGWIPCSERLPEKAGRYLVTCTKWGAWEVDWNIWYKEPKEGWLWEQSVSAWMPLPEAYDPDGDKTSQERG